MRPGFIALGHRGTQGSDMNEQGDPGLDAGGGGTGRTRIAVNPRLEMALEVVVEEWRHQGDKHVKAKDDDASKGSTSLRRGSHAPEYGHDPLFRGLVTPATSLVGAARRALLSLRRVCGGFASRAEPPAPPHAGRPEVRSRGPSSILRCRNASSGASRALRFLWAFRGRLRSP